MDLITTHPDSPGHLEVHLWHLRAEVEVSVLCLPRGIPTLLPCRPTKDEEAVKKRKANKKKVTAEQKARKKEQRRKMRRKLKGREGRQEKLQRRKKEDNKAKLALQE